VSYYVIPEIEQALILFAKYPEPGKVKRRLSAEVGNENAAKVYEAMLWEQLERISQMQGVSPYVFYRPEELMDEIEEWLNPFSEKFAMAAQMGDDLSERMRFAFKRIFSRNAIKKAIITSNDTPQVDEQVLQAGFDALEHHDFVVGPAANRGCYLLGMKSLQNWIFDEVPWPQEQMLEELIAVLNAHGATYKLLPELQPVQTKADLEAAWPDWQSRIK
jgi:uncharacterized protein